MCHLCFISSWHLLCCLVCWEKNICWDFWLQSVRALIMDSACNGSIGEHADTRSCLLMLAAGERGSQRHLGAAIWTVCWKFSNSARGFSNRLSESRRAVAAICYMPVQWSTKSTANSPCKAHFHIKMLYFFFFFFCKFKKSIRNKIEFDILRITILLSRSTPGVKLD